MNAIGYCRVSTESQAKEGISLDNQQERIKNYCDYKNYDLLEIIEDAGISGGKNKARAGFIELLDKLESGKYQVLILYSLERLSRDMLTLLAMEKFIEEYGVELHTIEGQLDTSTPDGFMGFAMRAFLGEMTRRTIKFNTHKALQHKKSKNGVVGAIPYGYRRTGDDIESDPKEQQVVSLINTLYSDGMGLTAISKELSARGIKTRQKKSFAPMQVKRVIKDYASCWTKSSNGIKAKIRDFIVSIA